MRKEGLRLVAIGLLAFLVACKYVRLELFQCVLVNYKIAGRDNYVNRIDPNPPVAALCFESWWAMSWTTRAEGKDAKPISQIRPTLDL